MKKTVLLPLAGEGSASQRIARAGLTLMTTPNGVEIIAVSLKGRADKAGFEQGFKVTGIEVPADRMAKEWLYLPALFLLVVVVLIQRMRREEAAGRSAPTAT